MCCSQFILKSCSRSFLKCPSVLNFTQHYQDKCAFECIGLVAEVLLQFLVSTKNKQAVHKRGNFYSSQGKGFYKESNNILSLAWLQLCIIMHITYLHGTNIKTNDMLIWPSVMYQHYTLFCMLQPKSCIPI